MPPAAVASPHSRRVSSPSKRKQPDGQPQSTASAASAIRDICEVLESYDTTPSILNCPLPSLSDSKAATPKPKRPKLADDQQPLTILSKARAQEYTSFADLTDDVAQSSAALLSNSNTDPTVETGDALAGFMALERGRLEANIRALTKVLRILIAQESREAGKDEDVPTTSVKHEDRASTAPDEDAPSSVLTVFGSAAGNRQLFSSSQRTVKRRTDGKPIEPGLAASVEERIALNEKQLPNQIASTTVIPTSSKDALPSSRRNLKFHDMFSSRSSLPALTPPKPSKRSAARDATITWTREPSRAAQTKHEYSDEKLPTGHWLGYGGVSAFQEPVSPEAKRKQRARTLSTGEAGIEASESAKAAQAQAKEDALFRSVYSSFAPSFDDSDAIVPEDVKADVWWERYGGIHYDQMFNAALPADSDDMETPATDGKEDELDEEQAFQDAVNDYEPVTLDDNEADRTHEDGATDVDVEKCQTEISELLESLLSHQRIRMSSLRPGAGQPSSTRSSTPPGPSGDEVKVYSLLRSKLASLVSTLPPYALAKANGDQLSDLIVSQQILSEGPSYQGVLEQDQASRLASSAALNSALGTQAGGRQSSSSNARAPHLAPSGRPGQGFGTGSNNVRGTPTTQRAPLSAWQTPAQQFASSAGQRGGYGQPASYNRGQLMPGYAQRPGSAQQVNGAGVGLAAQGQYQVRAQAAGNVRQNYSGGSSGGFAGSAGMTQPQAMYQQALQRPAGGYYPQSPLPALGRAPSRSQQSPMGGAGVAASPGATNGSRPQTPATPGQGQAQTQAQTQTPSKGGAGSP